MNQIIKDWITEGVLTDLEEQATWRNAASQFRLPYWDWARIQSYAGSFGIPQVFTVDSIPVIKPGGLIEEFPNPLVKFRNPENVAMGDISMGKNRILAHDPNDPNSKSPRVPPYNILPVGMAQEFEDLG